MTEALFEVVGTSKIWWDIEEMKGLCHLCSGDGELATTNRSAYNPEKYPEELIKCQSCGGTKLDRRVLRITA